ncbi:hypothetical protein [Candidatus Nitrospira bockiana]
MDTIAALFNLNWIDALVVAFLAMSAGALLVGMWRRFTQGPSESAEPQLERRVA